MMVSGRHFAVLAAFCSCGIAGQVQAQMNAGKLLVVPGDDFIVRLNEEGAFGNRRPANDAPGPDEIRIQFFMKDGQSYLIVTNGTSRMLDYEAWMTALDHDTRRTLVCTLRPGGRRNIEHWPHPIDALMLDNFRKATGQFMCQ